MNLFLQFGYGMKSLTIDLAKKWGGVTCILSPRDMTSKQLESWSKDFFKAGVRCLFDPQCYCPKSELKRLNTYSYWDSNLNTNLASTYSSVDQKIIELKHYNDIAQSEAYILPAILNDYDTQWSDRFFLQSSRFIESAHKYMCDKKIYATIALPKDLLVQSEDTIEPILQGLLNLDVDGYYIIAQAIDKKYLIDSPIWLSNILHICAVLKIAGKNVIYGYGNHQLLPLSLLQIEAMASGTWQNVRSFTNRFVVDMDEQKRKSTWVYHPESLSEYKLTFLDWAFNNGLLVSMKSLDKDFLDDSVNKIFQADAPPSSTGFTETDAFKHYLLCLKHQINLLEKNSYSEAYDSYQILLTTAEREIERLESGGVYAQARSFKNFIDVNRAAVSRLDKNHGFALRMTWNKPPN